MLTARPKVADLAFQLYGRSLHPELFDIHASRCIEREKFSAKIDITSAGHMVTWRCGGLTLTEIASSAQQPLPKRRRLMYSKLKGERKDRVECRGGVVYQVKFQLETVPQHTFWSYEEEFSRESQHEGIFYRFDASGRVGFGALSYIHLEAKQRSLAIRAFHTFPDDCAVVTSHSVIELP